jgi:hypothetical protein
LRDNQGATDLDAIRRQQVVRLGDNLHRDMKAMGNARQSLAALHRDQFRFRHGRWFAAHHRSRPVWSRAAGRDQQRQRRSGAA